MKIIWSRIFYTQLLLSLLLFSINSIAQPFQEVSQQVGINVIYGWDGLTSGGVSFVDFNMDGWDDLTFTTSAGDSIHFYQNNKNGTFTKLSSLVPETGWARGILWADFDNDGDRDFFIANEGSPNHLYENKGNLQLVNITATAGLPDFLTDDSYGASFCDYNNDGNIDLYVMNRTGQYSNQMFKNNGDKTFTNSSFTTNTHDSLRLSFTASFFDMNMDGYQDFFVAQDKLYMRNSLYKNNGNETFSDITDISGTASFIDGMSAAVGDYDLDGDQDIYVTNTPANTGNILYRNNGDETFTDVAEQMSVNMLTTSWGANFFDYDNDLDEDLFVCISDSFTKHNRLFRNNEGTSFTDMFTDNNSLPTDTIPCFSTAYGDFNNDGQIDIVAQSFAPFKSRLWQNTLNNSNKWLKIRLEGTQSNRDGIGTLLELYINGQKYIRYVHCGDGFLAQNSFVKHFGMSNHSTADSLIVKWLSGQVDRFYSVTANQTLQVQEGMTVSNQSTINIEKSFKIKNIYPNPTQNKPITIVLHSKKNQSIDVIFINKLGQIIYQEKRTIMTGNQSIIVPTAQIKETGVIRCIITNENERTEGIFLNLNN